MSEQPTNHEHDPQRDEQGRVLNFRRPGDRDGATVVEQTETTGEPGGPVVDAEIVDDNTPVRVDPPAPARVGGLPWERQGQRRPVIAPWLLSRDDRRAAGRWLAGHVWHATGFHAVRSPLYAARLAARSPRGAWVGAVKAGRWVADVESKPLRQSTISTGDATAWLRLHDARTERMRARRRMAITATALGVGGVLAVWAWGPPWLLWLVVAAAIGGLGWLGTPVDRPITGPSVLVQHAPRLTSDLVIRALGSLGLAEVNKALTRGNGITFPAPITRDGPGWRADVDLPFGVTVSDIMERRDKLASGLRRPLGCVWPEPAHDAHAGRLVLWVGDQDISKSRAAAWPLAKAGKADLFKPVPFGADQRGRPIAIGLMFASVLIGAMPRMGKTMAMRVLLLAAALDPGVELRLFELKGTGDLSMFEPVAHRYGCGPDDATIEATVTCLREVYAELERRAQAIRSLPRELCPENKVTPELAARRALKLWTQVIGIDECQELFAHPTYGKEADKLCTAIIKRGPALGIILILATQRPDKESLPTGISANVGIRFCLRVMGQTENDMVLGTSAYKNGLRATTFTAKDRGIGYLLGASDEPQIARSAYIDAPGAETIITRARAARERAGTITGHAAGDATAPEAQPARPVVADVAAVFVPGEDRLWSEVILARLAEQWPSVYGKWTPISLAAALKPYGVTPQDVWMAVEDGTRGTTRRGYLREPILAVQHTPPDRPGGDAA